MITSSCDHAPPSVPPPPYVIRGGRALCPGEASARALDIEVDAHGRIAALGSELAAARDLPVLALDGELIVPGPVDVHQHLDKTLTRERISNPDGTLSGAIDAFSAYASDMTREDMTGRAGRAIMQCLRQGTVAIRTHANVDTELVTRGVEALVGVRDAWRDRITLQVVAFATGGAIKRGAPTRKWLEDAISMGADVVGAAPHLADDPRAVLELVFDLAVSHGLPVDLHLDEHLDPRRQLFDDVVAHTQRCGLSGRVVIGHCCALSAMPWHDAARIVEALRESGIGVVTLPAANLFLQGRDAEVTPPRGLTRVRELLAAGVPVAAGSDNIQDPFVPVGSGDLLEIARWTLLAGGLSSRDLAAAFSMVSHAPAAMMGLGDGYGIRPGAWADLLIAPAADVEALVAGGAATRTVLFHGTAVTDGLRPGS